MNYQNAPVSTGAERVVRALRQEELPLLREHLLRLDHQSRHDRFHGFMDDSFIERYAEKCASDGTVVIGYLEGGLVRGAAELHPPETSPASLPEIAFSVEAGLRRHGVGSLLFRELIEEARGKGYHRLRITTGAQNDAMQALANKFGAKLTFHQGESTGTIEVKAPQRPGYAGAAIVTPIDAARAVVRLNRAYWTFLMRLYGWKQVA